MDFFELLSSLKNRTTIEENENFFDNSQQSSQEFFTSSSMNQSKFFPNTQNNSQFFQSYLSTQNKITNSYSGSSSDKNKSQSKQFDIFNQISQDLFSDSNNSDEFTDNQNKATEDSKFSNQSSHKSSTPEKSQIYESSLLSCEIEDFSTLPESIKQLYKEIKENFSDWTFTSIIAGQVCSDVFPMGAYNNLKIPLLMSLVSSQDSKLHIMAVGREITHASIIMSYMGNFSQRFSRVTYLDSMTVSNNNITEGGPLMLGTNGVSFLGNWQQFPQKSALKLLREIETKIILVDKIQKNYPLETTIWAYWSFTSKIKKDLASINQFINVFGIPIIIDDELYLEEIIDDLLNQQLVQSFDRSNDFHISENDLHIYINFAQSISVKFDPDADTMLKNYFMATRIIRPDALSEKSYEALITMAENHAKLCFRKIVNRLDALVAISIAEKFIKEFFDNDSFTSPPFDLQTESIDCYDKFMSDLFEWYTKFTKDILEK